MKRSWLLLSNLANTPGTHLHATLNDWDYPLSREGIIGINQYNISMKAHFKVEGDPNKWAHSAPYRYAHDDYDDAKFETVEDAQAAFEKRFGKKNVKTSKPKDDEN